jgi:hypothetical protein
MGGLFYAALGLVVSVLASLTARCLQQFATAVVEHTLCGCGLEWQRVVHRLSRSLLVALPAARKSTRIS